MIADDNGCRHASPAHPAPVVGGSCGEAPDTVAYANPLSVPALASASSRVNAATTSSTGSPGLVPPCIVRTSAISTAPFFDEGAEPLVKNIDRAEQRQRIRARRRRCIPGPVRSQDRDANGIDPPRLRLNESILQELDDRAPIFGDHVRKADNLGR